MRRRNVFRLDNSGHGTWVLKIPIKLYIWFEFFSPKKMAKIESSVIFFEGKEI